MAQLQLWTVTCTTCDSPAEYHCNTCGDILCSRCKEIHQRSRASGYHSVVPYSERLQPGKWIGQCDDHPGCPCMLWCQSCDKTACTECVTSADHKGHEFIKMASKLEERRSSIREEFEYYSKLLKTWEDSLQQAQCSTQAYEEDIIELGKKISMAADRVCDHVRSIEAALQKQLQEMRSSQSSKLHDQENALTNGIAGIKQQIKEAEDKLRSGDPDVVLNYRPKKDRREPRKPRESDNPKCPTFTSGNLDIQGLKAMMGSLSISKKDMRSETKVVKFQQSKTSSLPETQATASSIVLPRSALRPSTSSKMTLSLLGTVPVITTMPVSKMCIPYISCTGSSQAWVRTSLNTLKLKEKHGTVLKTTNIGFKIGGMTITPEGNLLISDVTSSSIKSFAEDGNFRLLFKTKWNPGGLCFLRNGYVMVAFFEDGKVVQYSRSGKMFRELDKSLLNHPLGVAQNRINKHVYACDQSDVYTDSPGNVLAFNLDSGRLEYKYTGHYGMTFTPRDVCTDQAGHVIITDHCNHSIHILDKDGRFLQYMMTKDHGLNFPYNIDINFDGYAWVSEWNLWNSRSQLKILKYITY